MTENVWFLVVTVVLATLAVVALVWLWLKDQRVRGIQFLLGGIGVVGLYLSGLMRVIWDGIKEMWSWSTSSLGITSVQVGLVLIVVAVVGFVVLGVWRSRQPAQHPAAKKALKQAEKKEAKQRAKSERQVRAQQSTAPAASDSTGSSTSGDPDMDEIDAILKNRGIN